MRLLPTPAPLQQTVGEARHYAAGPLVPATFSQLAKAVGAAEALKGEKYKPVIFFVKWGEKRVCEARLGVQAVRRWLSENPFVRNILGL
jgi:hypothetical protein